MLLQILVFFIYFFLDFASVRSGFLWILACCLSPWFHPLSHLSYVDYIFFYFLYSWCANIWDLHPEETESSSSMPLISTIPEPTPPTISFIKCSHTKPIFLLSWIRTWYWITRDHSYSPEPTNSYSNYLNPDLLIIAILLIFSYYGNSRKVFGSFSPFSLPPCLLTISEPSGYGPACCGMSPAPKNLWI